MHQQALFKYEFNVFDENSGFSMYLCAYSDALSYQNWKNLNSRNGFTILNQKRYDIKTLFFLFSLVSLSVHFWRAVFIS